MLYAPLKINGKARRPPLGAEQAPAFILGSETALRMSSEVPTPSATLTRLKFVALTSKQHPLPAAPPTLLHLRAALTLHSDTASTLPNSQCRFLLPGKCRCPVHDGRQFPTHQSRVPRTPRPCRPRILVAISLPGRRAGPSPDPGLSLEPAPLTPGDGRWTPVRGG